VIARGPDRIAHTILDNLVDLFKPVTDELRAEIEEIEARILSKHSETMLADLLEVRSEVAHLRQIIRPQRDVINRLAHGRPNIRAVMQP
jgi:magnesium transporter